MEEDKKIDFFKSAVEETKEEQVTDEEMGYQLDFVNADPDDYNEEENEEEYDEEDNYECIDTEAWEDFKDALDTYHETIVPQIRMKQNGWADSTKRAVIFDLTQIKDILLDIREESQYYSS